MEKKKTPATVSRKQQLTWPRATHSVPRGFTTKNLPTSQPWQLGQPQWTPALSDDHGKLWKCFFSLGSSQVNGLFFFLIFNIKHSWSPFSRFEYLSQLCWDRATLQIYQMCFAIGAVFSWSLNFLSPAIPVFVVVFLVPCGLIFSAAFKGLMWILLY